MLRSTFLHLTGIGPVGEAQLWARGVIAWDQLGPSALGERVPERLRQQVLREIEQSEDALARGDAAWFARRLPLAEQWRLYPTFRRQTAFLDIETTGLSPYEGIVTVVSVHGSEGTRTFVADDNLEELPAYLQRFGLLVTFNGAYFDVPFLQHRFPELRVPEAHLDLRFLFRRLGYGGGLKRIEQVLGLGDRTGVEGVHGIDAVRLWQAWVRGSPEALDRLIRYNRADTVNLEPLLAFAVRSLQERLTSATPLRAVVHPRLATSVLPAQRPSGV